MTADGNAGPLTILAPGTEHAGTLGSDAGTVVLDAASASRVTVPFDALLLTAQYSRDGDDLVLTGEGGETVIVKGYFALGVPPTLVTELGAQVDPTLAYRLANAEPLEQYAQAAGGAARKVIGEVTRLEGTVTANHKGGGSDTLTKGAKVYEGDEIVTAADGKIVITFTDDTRFGLGVNARMTLDNLVYNPAGSSSMGVSMLQGAFTFVSGKVAKTGADNMKIVTPVGTLGIRGTEGGGFIAIAGQATTLFISSGAAAIFNVGGTALITPGTAVELFSANDAPTIQQFDQNQIDTILGGAYRADAGPGTTVAGVEPAAGPVGPTAVVQAVAQLAQEGTITTEGGDETGEVVAAPEVVEVVAVEEAPEVIDLGEGDATSGNAESEIIAGGGEPPPPPPAPIEAVLNVNPDLSSGQVTGGVTTEDTLRVVGDPGNTNVISVGQEGGFLVLQITAGDVNETIQASQFEDLTLDFSGSGSDNTVIISQIDGTDIDETTIVLVGGSGNDTFDGSGNNVPKTTDPDVFISLQMFGNGGNDTLTGGSGNDLLSGGDGVDILFGLAGNDSISGGNESDLVEGGAGADLMNGNDGIDTLAYQGSAAGVTINLGDGSASGGDAAGDAFAGFENLIGSLNDDTLIGSDDVNLIDGSDGDDTIDGGGDADILIGAGGNDTLLGGDGNDLLTGLEDADVLNGGDGVDTADYTNSDAAVTVALGTAGNTGGHAEGDELIDIETVNGSGFGDSLTGDVNANLLSGAGGADTISGGGGADILIGGLDNDTVNGGDGDDQIFYAVGEGLDTVDGGADSDTVTVQGLVDTPTVFLIEDGATYNARIGTAAIDADHIAISVNGTLALNIDNVEDLIVNAGNAGDTLIVAGNFDGTDLDATTITFNGGDGTDTLDTSGLVSDHTVIANNVETIIDNGPPVAQDDSVTTDEDSVLNGDVLADNGNGPDSDPNADNLSIVEVNGQAADVGSQITLASGALLTVNGDGTFAYDPNGQFESLGNGDQGADSFTYTLSDGQATDTATVSITIEGVNDAPETDDVSANGVEDAASIPVTLTGSDVDGSVASFTLSSLPTDGTLFVDATLETAAETGTPYTATGDALTLFFVPDGDFNGEVTFDFVATDDDGLADASAATATITVTADNDPPVAQDDSVTTDEDSVLNGDVLADNGNGPDSDVEGGPLTVTEVNGQAADVGSQITLASGALLTLNGDGTFTYDPNGQFESLGNGDQGADSFTYTLSDGQATDTATVSITIEGVNDAPETDDVSANGAEDAAPIPVTLTGSDVDGSVASFTLSSLPANGTLFIDAALDTAAEMGTPYTATGDALTLFFVPNGDFNGEVTFDFFATDDDGLADASAATATITVTADNDAPVVTASGVTQVYDEGDDALAIEPALVVTDVDSPNLVGATVSITGGFIPDGGDVLGVTGAGDIVGSYNSATGVLTLTGIGTVAEYQAVLRTVTFSNTIENVNGDDRTISWQVDDGTDLSEVATSTVEVVPDGTFAVTGSAGDDIFGVEYGSVTVTVQPANETFTFDDPDLVILDGGGGAADVVTFQAPAGGSNFLIAGDNAETLVSLTQNAAQVSVRDFDGIIINGSDAADTIDASASSTDGLTLIGGGGDDTITGGSGDDLIIYFGDAGFDVIDGGGGTDSLTVSDAEPNVDGPNIVLMETGAAFNARNELTEGQPGSFTSTHIVISFEEDGELIPAMDVDGVENVFFQAGNEGDTLIVNGDFGDTDLAEQTITVNGGNGADTLDGSGITSAHRFVAAGNAGNDTLLGGGGDDDLNGGAGEDLIDGGAGNDLINVGDNGSLETPAPDGDADQVVYRRGDGVDTVEFFDPTNDTVVLQNTGLSDFAELNLSDGGTANTTLDLGDGSQMIFLGVQATDFAAGNFAFQVVAPTNSDDVLIGTPGVDTIDGLGGNDTIDGLGDYDHLIGGDGNDTLLSGGAPTDPINVFNGFDILEGGDGDDTLIAQGGLVIIRPGAGNDTIIDQTTGSLYDFTYVDYRESPQIIANLTDQVELGVAAGRVDDGLGGIDILVDTPGVSQGPHVLADSNGDDMIFVDDSFLSSFGNWIEVRLSGGDDQVVFDNVASARISYQFLAVQAGDPGVRIDLDPDSNLATNVATGVGIGATAALVGNDTITGATQARGSNGDDELFGSDRTDIVERFRGSDGSDMIDGRGGIDQVDHADSPGDVTVDLSQNLVLDDGFGNVDTLANIENAVGNFGDDHLTGDDSANVLVGLAGDDTLIGNGGNDTLIGDGGIGGDIGAPAGNDTLDGGAGNDYLDGGEGDDTLIGGDGFDFFRPGIGDDTIDGGAGVDDFDTVAYDEITGGGITYTGGNGGADSFVTGAAGSDTLTEIEELVGTNQSDVIQGGDTGDWFEPMLGNDTISGGDGFDTLTYRRLPDSIADPDEGVTITFSAPGAGTVTRSDFTDTFDGIEAVWGTAHDDTITGSIGNDRIHGTHGSDTLDGGDGVDTLAYNAIFPVTPGVSVDLVAGFANDGVGGTDTISNFEDVVGSQGDDMLFGDSGNNRLDAQGGTDLLDGRGGNDLYVSETGDNTMVFRAGEGNDRIHGFSAGASTVDVVRLVDTGFTSFADHILPRLSTDINGDAVLTLNDGSTLTFEDVAVAQLHQDDFVFDNTGLTQNVNGGAGAETFDVVFGSVIVTVSPSGDTFTFDNPQLVTINGGGGDDTISFDAPPGGSVFTLTDDGNDDLNLTLAGNSATIVVQEIETVVVNGDTGADLIDATGTDKDLQLHGNNGADTITGGGGNDLLTGGLGTDSLMGSGGDDTFMGGSGSDTMDGGDGSDTVDYSDTATTVIVNLATGLASGTEIGNDTLSNIENVIGGGGNDTITGGDGTNVLEGLGGNDTLESGGASHDITGLDQLIGGTGDDTLIAEGGAAMLQGGAGNDRIEEISPVFSIFDFAQANYSDAPTGIFANLTDDDKSGQGGPGAGNPGTGYFVFDGHGTTDTVLGVHVIGDSNFDDVIHVDTTYTNSLGNFIEVRLSEGDDTVVFEAGMGTARVSYADAEGGVHAQLDDDGNLATPGVAVDYIGGVSTPGGPNIGNDTFLNANRLRGSDFDDFLEGSNRTDIVEHFRGSGGNDIIDGHGGQDRIEFFSSVTGVTVDLSIDFVSDDGLGGQDTVLNIEQAIGSVFNDTITGGPEANVLFGFGGDDTIFGGDGNDALYGDAGLASYDAEIGGNDTLNGGAGDDRLEGGTGNDTLNGDSGNDLLIGGPGADVIDGGAGSFDTVAYGNASGPVVVQLGEGGAMGTAVVNGSVTDTLFNIERVVGSSHNDTITGSGNAFLEEFDGRGGDDTIDGNGGFDRVSYEQTPGGASDGQGGLIGVSVDLGAGTANDGLGGTDTLIDIDAIEGSNFTDNLTGRDDAPTRFRGRAGNDTFNGGTGTGDSAAYWFSGVTGAGVVVTLAAIGGTATGATVNGAINHTLNGIENVIGSEWADTITGDAGDNELNGLGGSDILDGGDGFDTVSYWREPQNYDDANQGVSVDLAAESAIDSFGSTDSLIDIENVVGTDAFGDTLSGDSNGNALIGLGGNDLISGLGGADFLNGGTGIDTVLGGAGNDTIAWVVGDGSETLDGGADFDIARLNGDPSAATNFVFSAGPTVNDATVVLSGASSETLVLTEIESVVVTGGAGADSISFSGSLAGTPVGFVTAFGQDGNDVFDATNAGIAVDLRGGNGNDTLTGDALSDLLSGGAGNDQLTGGGDDDIFSYNSPSDGTAWAGEANASLITADQITDFTSGADEIRLNGLEFDFTSNGPLDASNFVVIAGDYDGTLSGGGPSEYAAGNGTVIVDGGGQVIYDGNGAADGYSVIANVGASTPVVSTDINVVVPA